MSDFLNKAKDMAADMKGKIEDLVDKVEDHIPGHQDLKDKVHGLTDKADEILGDGTTTPDAAV